MICPSVPIRSEIRSEMDGQTTVVLKVCWMDGLSKIPLVVFRLLHCPPGLYLLLSSSSRGGNREPKTNLTIE